MNRRTIQLEHLIKLRNGLQPEFFFLETQNPITELHLGILITSTMTFSPVLIQIVPPAVVIGILCTLLILQFKSTRQHFAFNESSWQCLRFALAFLQLGLVGLVLFISERELDPSTFRCAFFLTWAFLSQAYTMADNIVAEQANRRPRPKFLASIPSSISSVLVA